MPSGDDENSNKYCTISINSAGPVTRYMPAEILNSAHGGNDCYIHFFLADFYDFFAIFKAFFTTSFYCFGTWPKWPLQPLHFGVFGAAVMRYYRYPLLRLDLTFGLSLMIPSNRTEIPSNLMGFRWKFRLRRLHSTCVCVKFKVQHGDPHQSVTSSIFSTSPLHRFLHGKKHGTCKQIQLECACKNLEKLVQNCSGNRTLGPTEGGGNDSTAKLI